MPIGCRQAYACIGNCLEFAKHALAATVLTMHKIRSDPEAFQKVCLIAFAIIRGFNHFYQKNYFPRLAWVLDNAQSFDVYCFCRLPRFFLEPYTLERIDGNLLRDRLEAVLCNNWHRGVPDREGKPRDAAVSQFSLNQLTLIFELMDEKDLAFRTEEQVRTFLQNQMIHRLEGNPNNEFDPVLIDLHELQIPLKKIPFVAALSEAVFVVVDVICVPPFLRDWGFIELSSYANRLGRFRLLTWLPEQSLDDWVRISMCIGFTLQFFAALNCLCKPNVKPKEASAARWLMAASLTEFIYNTAILRKASPPRITFFLFTAKTIGLLKILLTPERLPFDEE